MFKRHVWSHMATRGHSGRYIRNGCCKLTLSPEAYWQGDSRNVAFSKPSLLCMEGPQYYGSNLPRLISYPLHTLCSM